MDPSLMIVSLVKFSLQRKKNDQLRHEFMFLQINTYTDYLFIIEMWTRYDRVS